MGVPPGRNHTGRISVPCHQVFQALQIGYLDHITLVSSVFPVYNRNITHYIDVICIHYFFTYKAVNPFLHTTHYFTYIMVPYWHAITITTNALPMTELGPLRVTRPWGSSKSTKTTPLWSALTFPKSPT